MHHSTSLARLGAVGIIAIATACGGDSTRSPVLDFDPGQSSLTATPSTALADGTAEIRITARANDAQGNGIAGLGVRFTVTGAGNTLTPPSALTNASGVATVAVTSTVAGTKRVTALVDHEGKQAGFALGLDIEFEPTRKPAARLAFDSHPSTTSAGQSITPAITVLVQDETGATVATDSSPVTLSIGVNPATGSLSGTTTVNAVNGVATFLGLSVDNIGAGYTLTAMSGALTDATSDAFAITSGPAASLRITVQPSSAVAGAAIAPALEVEVIDAGGNRVVDATTAITAAIAANPSAGTLSGTKLVTAAAGVAAFSDLSLDKAGIGYTLVFTAPSLADATTSTFDVGAGPPVRLAFVVQPSTTVAGEAIAPAIEIEVLDSHDNRVIDATHTIDIDLEANPGPGTLGGTTSVAAVAGVARFDDLSVNRVAAGYTLGAASGALGAATSDAFAISHGAPASLSISAQPSATTAGVAIAPSVDVALLDSFGNAATTATNTVTVALDNNPSAGSLSGTVSIDAIAGIARFTTLSVDKAGAGYTLAATSGTLASATTDGFAVTAAAAAALVFTGDPITTIAGESIAPPVRVTVVDSFGNLVDSATNTIVVALADNPGASTLSGTASVSAVSGIAAFSTLSLDKAGAGYTLSAASGSLSGATSASFTITPAAAATLVVTAPTTTTAGMAFDLTIEALDAFGNTATGYAGSVDVTSGDAQAALPVQYTFVPGDAGNATISAATILRTSGSQSITATDAAGAPPTSATTNIAVAPAAIQTLVFTQQPTDVIISVAIAPAIELTAFDAYGNIATGFTGTVTLAITSNPGGATIGGVPSVTATNGVASFDNVSLSAAGMGYTLTATDSGAAAVTSASFDVLGAITQGVLVLTEVMHAPTSPVGDPSLGKWLELKNVSLDPIRVTGLVIEQRPNSTGGIEASFTVTSADIVAPGAHFVLGAAAAGDNGGIPVDFVYPGSFTLSYAKHLRVNYAGTVIDEVDFTADVSDNSGGATRAFPAAVPGQSTAHSFQTTSPVSNNVPWYWCNESAPTPGAANTDACGIAPVGTVDFCRTQLGGPTVLDTSGAASVYSQFFEATVTTSFHDGNDQYANVQAQVGWGTSTANPEATWTWSPARQNPSYVEFDVAENNDETIGQLAITSAATGGETVFYGFRYRLQDPTTGSDGAWVYCAKEGAAQMTLPSPGATGDYATVTVYPASAEIANARATGDGAGLSLPISGALVTYTRAAVGGDPAGFYVQGADTGPALLVEVDPTTLLPVPTVGDRVSFTITDMATLGGMRKATGIGGFSRISTGNDVSGFVQDLSTNADVVSDAVNYEHELSELAAVTITGAFAADGAGFETATINTAGVSGDANLRVRIASTLVTSNGLAMGCVLRVGPTPFAYSGAATTFQVITPSDLSVVSCPLICTPSKVVISQVYGGGGNTGAPYTADFVELHNRSTASADISGWSVQYASSTSSNWFETVVPGATILAPGSYYLVQMGAPGAIGISLPVPDLTGTRTMSATGGKVVLAADAAAFAVNCPSGATVVDFIGYGTTADCSETARASSGSNTNANLRIDSGCTDTDNNDNDFVTSAPVPRNTSDAALSCGCQ